MVCPGCRNVPLQMAERHGIEVEYCPACRGVWLDRGELDKIIERVSATPGGSPRSPAQRPDRGAPAYRQHDHDDDDDRRKKKRRGILDELFDFD